MATEPGQTGPQAKNPGQQLGCVLLLIVIGFVVGGPILKSIRGDSNPGDPTGAPRGLYATLYIQREPPTAHGYQPPPHVRGTVTNASDRKFGFVMLELNLYDTAGNIVGNSTVTVKDLDKGDTWSVDETVYDKAAVTVKTKHVTAF